MSTGIESELRAAFDEASGTVAPRANLAELVRTATRRRRRRLAVSAVTAGALILAGTGYAAATLHRGGHRPSSRPAHQHRGPRLARPVRIVTLPAGADVQAMAAAGRYLYVTTDHAGEPPYALAAYRLTTGRLVRRVSVPAEPSALRTGPGGSVWLEFYADQASGPSGTWLLNADLHLRSGYSAGLPDILPTGARSALLPTQYGLTALVLPPPGVPGQPVASADPEGKVDGRFAITRLAAVGGTVVAQVTNGYGFHSHLVIAGRPKVSYGGGADDQVGFVTAEAGGFWMTLSSDASPSIGRLVRLDPGLHVVTPAAVRASPALRRAEQVWSAGSTVWVASATARHSLVCFGYRGGVLGQVDTIRVAGEPVALAAAGRVVYVSVAAGDSLVTSSIRAYAVPRACR